ncbi:MAG: hypothetical protein AAF639_43005 [Chloroflexota bacterium]
MAKIKVGQLAPDLTLKTVDDEITQLSTYWGDTGQRGRRHALIIFLRHLA